MTKAKAYRERDAKQTFLKPASKQEQKRRWEKVKVKKRRIQKSKGLTHKQRAAEAHAHYLIHHGSAQEASRFLQHSNAKCISAITLNSLRLMCANATTSNTTPTTKTEITTPEHQ